MKIRRLQQWLEGDQWEDHGYAYARADGRASFRYNTLVWGRIGARYNVQLREAGTPLEEVHTVIPTGTKLRWLAVEEIEGEPEAIKAELDKACQIPQAQPLPFGKSTVT
jgi:hypothetical protein